MSTHGTFYKTIEHQYYYFDHIKKELFGLGDDLFNVLIESRYELNASEKEYAYLIQSLRTHSETKGEETEVYQFSWYDAKNFVLYLDNNDNQIYRINGDSIQLVDNGADGVLFLKNQLHEKFCYEQSVTGVFDKLLIDTINFVDGKNVNLDADEQKLIFGIWIYSLFFESLQPTKPLQFFLGEKGSGKTTHQRVIGRWLFGSKFDVVPINKDKEDSFIVAVTNNYFVAFDNLDNYIRWLPDRLAQIATGQKIQMRELFTTNTEQVYSPKCFVSLNSREPKFKRDDVVDRLLLFRVKRLDQFRPDSEILSEIAELRDDLWSEVIDQLNQIVRVLKNDTQQFTSTFRMADFAKIGWRIAKALGGVKLGDHFIELLEKMDQERNEFLIEDNPIVELLDLWLKREKKEVPTSELFSDLKDIAENENIEFDFRSARSFGMHFRHIVNNLREHYNISESRDERTRSWRYKIELDAEPSAELQN